MSLSEDDLARDEEAGQKLLADVAKISALQGLGGGLLSPAGVAGVGALGALSAAGLGGLLDRLVSGEKGREKRGKQDRKPKDGRRRDGARQDGRRGAREGPDESSPKKSRSGSDRLSALTEDMTLAEVAAATTGALFGAAALGAAAYGISKKLSPKIKVTPKSEKPPSHLDVGESRAGRVVVQRFDGELGRSFQTWVHLEQDSNTGLGDVLKLQALGLEVLLDRLLIAGTEPIRDELLNCVDRKKDKFVRDHLSKVFSGSQRRTFVTIEAQARAFRRALEAGSSPVVKWVGCHFHKLVRPAPGTIRGFVNDLREKTIIQFISRIRNDFRNPAAHGELGDSITPQQYQEWCDLVYGTASVRQWWTVGVDPKLYKPSSLGCLNLLMLARRL